MLDQREDAEVDVPFGDPKAADTWVVATSVAVSIADGFDLNAISFAAPFFTPLLHLSPQQLGTIFSIGLVGAVLGALLAGTLSVRFGRRSALIVSLVWFAVGSFSTMFVGSYAELLAARFITGLGLGIPLPLLLAVIGDSVPAQAKARVLSLSFAGMPIGGLLVSLSASYLVPNHGWPAIFFAGGVFPLLVIPIVLQWRDEVRTSDTGRPEIPLVNAAEDGGNRPSSTYVDLFRDGRLFNTVTIMPAILLSSMLTYFLLNWIPSLLANHSGTGRGVAGGALLSVGMILSTIIYGFLIDKLGVFRVTGLSFLAITPLVLGVGALIGTSALLFPAVFLTGFFAIGAQLGTTFLLITRFDARVRVFASSIGYIAARTGAILAPLIAGILLEHGFGTFFVFAVAAAVAMAGMLTLATIGSIEQHRRPTLSAA